MVLLLSSEDSEPELPRVQHEEAKGKVLAVILSPYQQLANLSKSHCLQERLNEDARLLEISDGSRAPSSFPISGKLPPPQERAKDSSSIENGQLPSSHGCHHEQKRIIKIEITQLQVHFLCLPCI